MEPCKVMQKTVEVGDRNQHSRGEDSPKEGVLGLAPHCSVSGPRDWGDGARDRCLIEPQVRPCPKIWREDSLASQRSSLKPSHMLSPVCQGGHGCDIDRQTGQDRT